MEILPNQPDTQPEREAYYLARFRRFVAKLPDNELDRKVRYILQHLVDLIGPEVLPSLVAALHDENRRRGFE